MFGNIKEFPGAIRIGGRMYPSLAEILASVDTKQVALKPDFVINYKPYLQFLLLT